MLPGLFIANEALGAHPYRATIEKMSDNCQVYFIPCGYFSGEAQLERGIKAKHHEWTWLTPRFLLFSFTSSSTWSCALFNKISQFWNGWTVAPIYLKVIVQVKQPRTKRARAKLARQGTDLKDCLPILRVHRVVQAVWMAPFHVLLLSNWALHTGMEFLALTESYPGSVYCCIVFKSLLLVVRQ